MKPLDKNVFGATKAAEKLATILTEIGSVRLCNNVSRFLCHSNKLVKDVGDIADLSSRLAVYNLIHGKIKNHEFGEEYPLRVVTYTKNVALSVVKRATGEVTLIQAILQSEKSREQSRLKNRNSHD